MTTPISQSEYYARMKTFKTAMKHSFALNVCHGDGSCANGCIGRVQPPQVQLRCPAIYASSETLAAAQVEYDRALEAISDVNIVPDEPAAAVTGRC